MQYRRFGATDLTVSSLGFGCARLGGVFQSSSTAAMLKVLHTACEQGITFYDTADMYAQGESETLLGTAFRGRRSSVVIATKAGYCLPSQKKLAARIKPLLKPVIRRVGITRQRIPSSLRGGGSPAQDFSPRYLLQAAERSLQRLGTDYLDLYQLHSPPATVLESGDFLDPLEKLKSQGKIRYYGVACDTVEDALLCLRYSGISSLQIGLNLLDQRALDDLIVRAHKKGIAIIARQGFASGLLTGPVDLLPLESIIPDKEERDVKRSQIMTYQRIAESYGRPLPQMALQFVLRLEGIAVALLGMSTARHLSDNLHHMAAPPLSDEELRAARAPAAS